jgi:hypothetical protein
MTTPRKLTSKEIKLMSLSAKLPRTRSAWFGPLTVAAALVALGAAPARAQSVLYGCYVPNSGTVYRIKGAGLPDECRSPQHVQFTWSLQGPAGQQGPAGPTGPQGVQGPAGGLSGHEVVTSSINVAPGPVLLGHAADCPTGKKVVGGGFFAESARTGVLWTIQTSRPGQDPFTQVWSRWGVEARHNAATQQTLVVYAVCATAN